jgi:hypothetical protein
MGQSTRLSASEPPRAVTTRVAELGEDTLAHYKAEALLRNPAAIVNRYAFGSKDIYRVTTVPTLHLRLAENY